MTSRIAGEDVTLFWQCGYKRKFSVLLNFVNSQVDRTENYAVIQKNSAIRAVV